MRPEGKRIPGRGGVLHPGDRMAGRLNALIGLIVLAGTFWLAGQTAQTMHSSTGAMIAMVCEALAVASLCWPVVWLMRRAGARRAVMRQSEDAVAQHLEALLRRRAQLVRVDPYGKPRSERWDKEIDYFIDQHVAPLLTRGQQAALDRCRDEVAGLIAARVEAAMQEEPTATAFPERMTPTEFEAWCAEELRHAGWDAQVTMQSRDQGVDVIAARDGRRVVLQCKFQARPVGNKSVQEAAAARAHEQADFGVVVSNHRYTEAAEQLAATNGILLLHWRDLRRLDEIIEQLTRR